MALKSKGFIAGKVAQVGRNPLRALSPFLAGGDTLFENRPARPDAGWAAVLQIYCFLFPVLLLHPRGVVVPLASPLAPPPRPIMHQLRHALTTPLLLSCAFLALWLPATAEIIGVETFGYADGAITDGTIHGLKIG